MGPPLRNFAADAHDCIMVEVHEDQPNTRLWRVDPHTEGEFPLGSHCPMPGLPTGRRVGGADRMRPAGSIALPSPFCRIPAINGGLTIATALLECNAFHQAPIKVDGTFA